MYNSATPWTAARQVPLSSTVSQRKKRQPTTLFLPGESQEQYEKAVKIYKDPSSNHNSGKMSFRKERSEAAQSCLTICRLLSPWDFPGMNTGVGCYFLLQMQVN